MTIRFVATKVCCKDLKPGDLFSTVGREYWDRFDPLSVGERVYVRTNSPCPADQTDETIFRITIIQEDEVDDAPKWQDTPTSPEDYPVNYVARYRNRPNHNPYSFLITIHNATEWESACGWDGVRFLGPLPTDPQQVV